MEREEDIVRIIEEGVNCDLYDSLRGKITIENLERIFGGTVDEEMLHFFEFGFDSLFFGLAITDANICAAIYHCGFENYIRTLSDDFGLTRIQPEKDLLLARVREIKEGKFTLPQNVDDLVKNAEFFIKRTNNQIVNGDLRREAEEYIKNGNKRLKKKGVDWGDTVGHTLIGVWEKLIEKSFFADNDFEIRNLS